MKSKVTTLTVCFAIATVGFASSGSGAFGASSLPLKTQGSVTYVTGGIGESESMELKHAAAGYPLELLFAEKTQHKDAYIADVRVTIRDRSDNALLDTKADGPFLLARLPAGKYRIDAEYGRVRKHQAVEIRPGKHRRAVFVWASQLEGKKPAASTALLMLQHWTTFEPMILSWPRWRGAVSEPRYSSNMPQLLQEVTSERGKTRSGGKRHQDAVLVDGSAAR